MQQATPSAMHDLENLDLFASAAVLPAQFFEISHQYSGEHRLMLAVLKEGLRACINDPYAASPSRPSLRGRIIAEAQQWLASEDDVWPFAFITICHTLDIDSEYLRRLVRAHHGV